RTLSRSHRIQDNPLRVPFFIPHQKEFIILSISSNKDGEISR
ncbi:hypothetical protein LINPERHAP1_LOCUS37754, partial [Linum perenne]